MDGYTSIMLDHAKICHDRRANKCKDKDKNNKIDLKEKPDPKAETRNKNCVCRYCYSYIQASVHTPLRKKMSHNSTNLSNLGYTPKQIYTPNNCLRYTSFGEVHNHIQVINILRHAKENPHLHKAVWTKMYGLWKMKGLHGGVEQLNLIWSCSKINCQKFIIPKGFTKSFYVYSTQEELQNAIIAAQKQGYKTFECNKQCKDCNHCYKNSETTIVMELLRKNPKKNKEKLKVEL